MQQRCTCVNCGDGYFKHGCLIHISLSGNIYWIAIIFRSPLHHNPTCPIMFKDDSKRDLKKNVEECHGDFRQFPKTRVEGVKRRDGDFTF